MQFQPWVANEANNGIEKKNPFKNLCQNCIVSLCLSVSVGCSLFQTPMSWLGKWDGPEDPILYLRTLVARTQAIQGWVKKAESKSLLSETLDLSELFHPDTFLNALRQLTARWVTGFQVKVPLWKCNCWLGYEVAVVAALSFPKDWVSQGTLENDLYAQTIALLAPQQNNDSRVHIISVQVW